MKSCALPGTVPSIELRSEPVVRRVRCVHVITGLDIGGAEMMLCKLLSRINRAQFDNTVVSLMPIGPVGERIRDTGIQVHSLSMRRGGLPDPQRLWQLWRLLKRLTPDIVQTWLYHADLLGGLAAKLSGPIPVIWGIRGSLDARLSPRTTVWTARACAALSHWIPRQVVCCSDVARTIHIRMRYAADRMVVIPNGFDLTEFHPAPEARAALRRELGVAECTPLVGLAARFNPQKDHRTFVEAARLLRERMPQTHFVLCGDGVIWANRPLAEWTKAAGVHDACHLLGRLDNMPRFHAALDVGTSSSAYGEGFPNAIGEAMACGVPCAVTDVGDTASLVGQTGRVVPPRDPVALAEAWHELLTMDEESRQALGRTARERIAQQFSLECIVRTYESLYTRVVDGN
jgi:glycosyltransferase involved in cell wall biosynthesis